MSVSSVGASPTDTYSSTQSAYNSTNDAYSADNTTQSVESTSDNDYSDSWAQLEQDSCNQTMQVVNQSQADEKKNDQEVYHQDDNG